MDPDVFVLAFRLFLAGLWLVAATDRLRRQGRFAADVQLLASLPPAAVTSVSRLVPAAELVLGLALLTGTAVHAAGAASAVLGAAHAAAAAVLLRRRRAGRLLCLGGIGRSRVTRTTPVRAAVLSVGAAGLTLHSGHHGSLPALAAGAAAQPGPHAGDVAAVVLALVGLLAAQHVLETLLAVRRIARGRSPEQFLAA